MRVLTLRSLKPLCDLPFVGSFYTSWCEIQKIHKARFSIFDFSLYFYEWIRQIHQNNQQNKIRNQNRRARVIFGDALTEKQRDD